MTSKMADRPSCLCCGQSKAKYFGLFSKKLELENVKDNMQLLFEHKLDFQIIPNSVICHHCLQITIILPKIKSRISNLFLHSSNANTTVTPEPKTRKRPPSTPAAELRLKVTPTRKPIISSLVRSFEKLKTPSGSETREKERSGISRRRINFEHSYSFNSPNTVDNNVDSENVESILSENVDWYV